MSISWGRLMDGAVTAGKVLACDGAGKATWVSPASLVNAIGVPTKFERCCRSCGAPRGEDYRCDYCRNIFAGAPTIFGQPVSYKEYADAIRSGLSHEKMDEIVMRAQEMFVGWEPTGFRAYGTNSGGPR